ncbi:MAG TPA: DOMON-like domain-containing protein [Chroococcales cyanobacterium]
MTFSLQPFFSTDLLPNLQITGDISRNENQLHLDYTLSGNLKEVLIAAPSEIPTRKHELWQETCFEFFLGINNSEQYWEFNLSPAGHWNVYRFDGYRQGMQEEIAFSALPFSVEDKGDYFAIALGVDLDKIVSPNQVLDVAITTVIKQRDGEVSYWALTHRGTEADFHLRESFVIEL